MTYRTEGSWDVVVVIALRAIIEGLSLRSLCDCLLFYLVHPISGQTLRLTKLPIQLRLDVRDGAGSGWFEPPITVRTSALLLNEARRLHTNHAAGRCSRTREEAWSTVAVFRFGRRLRFVEVLNKLLSLCEEFRHTLGR